MRRPLALRVTILLLGLLAVLQLAIAAVVVIVAAGAFYRVYFLLMLSAVWMFVTAVGMARLRLAALISIYVVAVMLSAVALFGMVSDAVVPQTHNIAVMSMGYLGLLTIGVWWLIYFTRPATRALFRKNA